MIVSSRLPHLTQQVQILKSAPIGYYYGLSHPTGWAALPSENLSLCFFSRTEKPSADIIQRFIFDEFERVNNNQNIK
jgi:hypothetical protein